VVKSRPYSYKLPLSQIFSGQRRRVSWLDPCQPETGQGLRAILSEGRGWPSLEKNQIIPCLSVNAAPENTISFLSVMPFLSTHSWSAARSPQALNVNSQGKHSVWLTLVTVVDPHQVF
jgi:hypothetical protein